MVCISAYFTAGRAKQLSMFHNRIAQLQEQKEDLDARKPKMNAIEYDQMDAALEGELSRWSSELAPRQEPIEYSFYVLALMVGLVMGGIQSAQPVDLFKADAGNQRIPPPILAITI